MARQEVLDQLTRYILSLIPKHPVRVAIDGIDAAGKTILADELVRPIQERGREVIRASIDGFHRPKVERYERGLESPKGYFLDSFDYASLRSSLLIPLGPGGNNLYRTAVFDYRTDSAVSMPPYIANPDAVLLFDGVFLLRPQLNDCWDFRILVLVDFEVSIARGVERAMNRGPEIMPESVDVEARYRNRYVPGQRIYLQTVRPERYADVIIDNNNPADPKLLKSPVGRWP